MTDKNYKFISRTLITIACVLILGGCFAPFLFTRSGREQWDFTNTGQIGDTIGGTMGPFIAIAGVITTFIAFLMQVQANDIQRGQMKKSFHLNNLQDRLEERDAMQLLSIDIKAVLHDIDVRTKEILEFCDKLDSNPFSEIACKRPSDMVLGRYQSINRNKLFNAFQHIVGKDSETVFIDVYNSLDYYFGGVNSLFNDVYFPYTKDIMSKKEQLPEKYLSLIDAIRGIETFKGHLESLKESFLNKKLVANNILQLKELADVLNDQEYKPLFDCVPSQYDDIIGMVKPIGTYGELLSYEMRKGADSFTSNLCKGRLTTILTEIESALSIHSIENIQKDFDEKIS